MHNEEKYSDRRRDKRRHNRSSDPESEIQLPDQDGKTINVSASGVCFEVALKDMEAFSLGTTIPRQINTVTNKSGFSETKLKLSGKGTVIRNWIIENPDHENSLSVALEFTEKLDIVVLDKD